MILKEFEMEKIRFLINEAPKPFNVARTGYEKDQPTWGFQQLGVGPNSKGGQLTISSPLFGRQFRPIPLN